MRGSLVVGVALSVGSVVAVGCKEGPPKLHGPAISAVPSGSDEKLATPPIKANVPKPPEDKFPLSEDQIAAIVNPKGATEYTGPTGVIEGVVKVKGDPPAMRTFVPLPEVCEPAKAIHGPAYRTGPGGTLGDTLVAVIGVSGYVRPSRDDKKVTIKNCSIEPTVIDLSLGQRLMIANADAMPYMPQLATKQLVHKLVIKDMSAVPLFLTAPGVYGMTWLAGQLPGTAVPQATIFVLPSALHTVTELDGKFRITGVPVGKAMLTLAHLDMDEVRKEVEIKAGAETKVELVMTYKAPPATAASASASASAPKPHSSIH